MRYLEGITRYWWIVFLSGVTGGLVGLLAAGLLPATYRAQAVATIAIDYSRASPMDANVERQIYLRIQDVLLSDKVLEGAAGAAGEVIPDGTGATPDALRDTIRLYDTGGTWFFEVVARDSAWAAGLASAWAEAGLESIRAAQVHAMQAAEAQSLFFEAACRPAADPHGPELWACTGYEPQGSQADLAEAVVQEATESLGIPPVLTVSLNQDAATRTERVTPGRVEGSIAGALVGLIAGVALAAAVHWRRIGDPRWGNGH